MFQLEDLLVDSCQALLSTPRHRPTFAAVAGSRWPRALVRRAVGAFQALALPQADGPQALLLIGLSAGTALDLLGAIPDWRRRFDLVAAWVWDCWEPWPAAARQLDHVFVPVPEQQDEVRRATGVPVTLLPLAADVLRQGSAALERPIDLISYGRISPLHHQAFTAHYNRPDAARIYLRMVSRGSREPPPSGPWEARADRSETELLYQLLRRSSASLCFDTLYPSDRRFPHSFVTLRWFDAIATGCAALGRRPTTPEADRLLDWEDATVELPEDARESLRFVEGFLGDAPRLAALRARNHAQALARHDWRHRLRDLLAALGLPLPTRLGHELEQLARRAVEVRGATSAT